MKYLLILLFPLLLFSEKLEWNNLSEEQRMTAVAIYDIASKYNLAETMIAIAWQESRLGKIPINLEDKASCGVHHIHIKTFLWLNNIPNTVTNRNIYCMELINDLALDVENAIKFFDFAKNKWNGDHNKAIMSYNAGFNLKNNEKAKQYHKYVKQYMEDAKAIIELILTLRQIEQGLLEYGDTL